ncbi:hypothetical protein GGI43DRAFT_418054 [Trichoderma evansii]
MKACGRRIQNNDLVVLLPKEAYSDGVCHKRIQVTYNDPTITGTVEGLCSGCSSDAIQLTGGFF